MATQPSTGLNLPEDPVNGYEVRFWTLDDPDGRPIRETVWRYHVHTTWREWLAAQGVPDDGRSKSDWIDQWEVLAVQWDGTLRTEGRSDRGWERVLRLARKMPGEAPVYFSRAEAVAAAKKQVRLFIDRYVERVRAAIANLHALSVEVPRPGGIVWHETPEGRLRASAGLWGVCEVGRNADGAWEWEARAESNCTEGSCVEGIARLQGMKVESLERAQREAIEAAFYVSQASEVLEGVSSWVK